MKFRFVINSLILSLIAFNAHAFSSFNIQYPEGTPEIITVEVKYSTGKCALPSTDYNCHNTASTSTFRYDGFARYMQSFIQEYRNTVFSNDPLNSPNNYIRLSIPNQSNICQINLNTHDININLHKNGSC